MKKDIIRDPIYGYIIIYPWERAIIDTPEFQRLRYIKQTPGASYVYPGANHTRFEHSLGVLKLMGELIEEIQSELKEVSELNQKDLEKELYKIRIAALLHDLGHCPFSHVFEDFLRELDSSVTHEKITQVMIKHLLSRLKDDTKVEQNSKFNLKDLSDDDIKHISQYAVGDMGCPEIPLNVLIGDTIDVDKMDYLLRDSYHTGTIEYGNVDVKRILLATKLIKLSEEQVSDLTEKGQIDYSENGGKEVKLAISERAIASIESFLISRYKMYQNVYYHRTTRGIERTLIEMLKDLASSDVGLNLIQELLKCKKSKDVEKLFKKDEYTDEFIYNFNDYSLFSELCKFKQKIKILKEFQKRNIFREVHLKVHKLASDSSNYGIEINKDRVKEKLKDLKIDGVIKVAVDVPFPLLPIKSSKIFIINNKKDRIYNLVKFIQESKYTSLLRDSFFVDFGEGKTLVELIFQRVYVLYKNPNDYNLRKKIEKEVNRLLKRGFLSGPQNI